ncbi:MotA/TolQ/ExbB proton channel family protein [Tissierella sp. Yu-01]|uniref:motility protein A n=1 Tax=Tissierella sp. Yu-01 TaxID=3035694 RepID=UPI00240D677D|nr:MotA/TolQ/ExbB proton channel family protein [Tissierella sp. Yu-01]WFA07891.1 MotA/TolQ/ExbB proton channel family protein [Tissierella sp. Yu-01]
MKKRSMSATMGLIAGVILVFWSIKISGDLSSFWDIPSIIITLGGSLCAMVISFPLKTLKHIPNMLKLLVVSPQDNRNEIIILLTELSKKARRDGLLALEDDIAQMDNEFMASGLQMVVDGVEPDNIRELMELKIDTMERRHRSGQSVFLKWGELAPAYGMIGTLIGLILMLVDLDDPSAIGGGMAVALVTTFYGSFLANLVFLPIANNLSEQTDEEIFTCQMVIDGVLQIQAGTNPRLLEEKLLAYLAPDEQKNTKDSLNAKEAVNYE